jgi:hypothetical protein
VNPKWGQTPFFSFSFVVLAALLGGLAWGGEATLELPDGRRITYSIIPPGAPGSALPTAQLLHEHLAAGDITEAAALSNTPRRRYEVLREYRDFVGEDEFKRVYQSYLHPGNRVVAEIAIGRHRLLIWKLVGLERLAGEFFVDVEGRLLIDDVPGETRAQLRQVLRAYRQGR